MLALLPDNARGDITASDMRVIVTDLFNRDLITAQALDEALSGIEAATNAAASALASAEGAAQAASTAQSVAGAAVPNTPEGRAALANSVELSTAIAASTFRNAKIDGGAAGNGSTNDTAAIQSLVNALSTDGGGIILLPPGEYVIGGLTLKDDVQLASFAGAFGYQASNKGGVIFRAPTGFTGTMVTSAASRCGIQGVTFIGGGTALRGIDHTAGAWASYKVLNLGGFTGPSMRIAGVAHTVEDVLAYNSWSAAPTTTAGVIEVRGTDHYLHRVESSGSQSVLTSGSLYKAGIHIEGTNCFVSNCVGEFADIGIRVSGNTNRFTGTRADRNFGHGWHVIGAANLFSACHAVQNSKAATNTYDGFLIEAAYGNSFAACEAVIPGGSPQVHKYGFEDKSNNADPAFRTKFYGCESIGDGSGPFQVENWLGATVEVPRVPIRPSDGSTSVDVARSSLVILQGYTTPTVITQFTGGHSGREITLIGNANVTIQNNATIKTSTGANKVLAANLAYRFVHYNGVWYELG